MTHKCKYELDTLHYPNQGSKVIFINSSKLHGISSSNLQFKNISINSNIPYLCTPAFRARHLFSSHTPQLLYTSHNLMILSLSNLNHHYFASLLPTGQKRLLHPPIQITTSPGICFLHHIYALHSSKTVHPHCSFSLTISLSHITISSYGERSPLFIPSSPFT